MPNRTLLASARWLSSTHQSITDALEGMTEPYTLASMYPPREVLNEDGTITVSREILPHQLAIHNKISPSGKTPMKDKTWYMLHSGGVGSGKSIGCFVEMLSIVRKYPKISVWSIYPYDYYIDQFGWPSLREILPDDSPLIERINLKTRVYTFKNGSTWTFHAFDDPSKVKGFSCTVMHLCEASEIGGNDNQKGRAIFNMLLQRMRTPSRNYPRIVIAEQNPSGHNWVWATWIKDSPMRQSPKVTWLVRPEDDPLGLGAKYEEWERIGADGSVYYAVASGSTTNTKNAKGYIESMLDNYQMDDSLRRRMVMGSFDPIDLLVFGEPYFSMKRNLVDIDDVVKYWQLDKLDKPFPECIKEHWKLIVGIDTAGASSPWAVEFFVETPTGDPFDPVKHLLGFDEIYIKGLVWQDIANLILEKTAGWRNVEYWIDPVSSNQRSGPDLKTVLEEFSTWGIPCQTPSSYRTQTSWMHVHSLLHGDPSMPHVYLEEEGDEDPDTGKYQIGMPSLMFLKSKALQEVPVQGKGRNNPNGWMQYALGLEMGVYRYDSRKQREQKAWEEGLTPVGPEKVISRDDHGITAMYFCTLGWHPPQKRSRGMSKELTGRRREPLYPGERTGRRR